MTPSDKSFKADSAERLLEPQAASPPSGPSRYLAPVVVCLVYVTLLSLLVLENALEPVVTPTAQEIPVEIVVEPPPPEPDSPAPKPEPQPPAQSIDEETAYDAPRAASKEKAETEAVDEASKAPPAPLPVKPPGPDPDPGQVAGPLRTGEPDKENSAEPVLDKPAAQTTSPAELNHEKPEQKEANAAAAPEKDATAGGDRIPSFESVPEVDFGAASAATPIAGGNARATYLSILYGMIMAHMHSPGGVRSSTARAEGMIFFSVDGAGRVVQRRIARASGSHELDLVALNAIGKAGPFPRPPGGIPIGLKFSYGAD